ncbi:hypothetical protein [Brevundimonas poindexterae]|uniref:hypothetical protein n=1 Tax=Brevundimonas poindexterae TaxID=74325 RepID=UPI001CFE78AA|nr:hypothetical protein [Brevundimonas poindexterae]
MSERAPGDRYLKPGTRVRLTYEADAGSEGEPAYDDGVVVHCWWDHEIEGYDCYVALFGDAIPPGQPKDAPWVQQYAVSSLTVLEGDLAMDPLAAPSWAVREDDRARMPEDVELSGRVYKFWSLGLVTAILLFWLARTLMR